jgi:hypothetical protein
MSREDELRAIDARSERAKHLWTETDPVTKLTRIYEVPDLSNPLVRVPRSEWLSHSEAMAAPRPPFGYRYPA